MSSGAVIIKGFLNELQAVDTHSFFLSKNFNMRESESESLHYSADRPCLFVDTIGLRLHFVPLDWTERHAESFGHKVITFRDFMEGMGLEIGAFGLEERSGDDEIVWDDAPPNDVPVLSGFRANPVYHDTRAFEPSIVSVLSDEVREEGEATYYWQHPDPSTRYDGGTVIRPWRVYTD